MFHIVILMIMQKILLFITAVFLFAGCGSTPSHGKIKVGVDRNWYPLNFGEQTAYINGFTDELLLEISRYSGIEIEKIPANWDTLLSGLQKGNYDAVLSSLPPYEYNRAKYDFSSNFLNIGPVLILRVDTPNFKEGKMDGKMIGLIANDPVSLILEKTPTIIQREYNSIPELLNGLLLEEIDGAVLDQIPAVTYVGDLYAGKLKVASEPMTDAGLHMVALKDKGQGVEKFESSLKNLSKQGKVKALLEKWELTLPSNANGNK